MEFGNSNSQPLLSIAIPTWNRAKQLKTALDRLLPEISNYSNLIELIISDNASTDNTKEVILETISEFPNHNIVFFSHEINSGFYGNFKKCTSLGTGKFFWLLSDDDFLFKGVIDTVMEVLQKEKSEFGAIFLNDWTDDDKAVEKHSYDLVNMEDFFKIGNYRHTLISSVIYSNVVKGNDELFISLKGNALIAYPIFLKSVANYKNFAVLNGNSLLKTHDEVRFDALGIFTVELAECLKVGYRYLPKHLIDYVANQFLSTLIITHYKDFKYKGAYNTKENQSLSIFKYYLKYKRFWLYILPVILLSDKNYHVLKSTAKRTLKPFNA